MLSSRCIKIRGARVHNLKNIDIDIPKEKIVAITGISGSGKSSLAFDTIYAEGQRKYVESLSPYIRQFLGVMDRPDVDKIEGISPAISIDQKRSFNNPRSTVGTMTEIYDYLRLLFARAGICHCPNCGKQVSSKKREDVLREVLNLKKANEIIILAPIIERKKGEHKGTLEEIKRAGFVRVRIDGSIYRSEEAVLKDLDKNKKHSIETVVDSLVFENGIDKARLVDSLETAFKLGKGNVIINHDSKDIFFSEHFGCKECGISFRELDPRSFSFNSPYGACPVCHGLGKKLEVDPKLVLPNLNLTLAEGAIFPWAHASHKIGRQGYFWKELQDLTKRKNISLDDPVKDLSPKFIDIILYGDDAFEGVIPNLERRHRETSSEHTRQEIEQYMVESICPSCKGKRLKPEILAVKVAGYSIDKIVSTDLVSISRFFEKIQTSDNSKIIQPIVKEITNRLESLISIGLGYLSLSRSGDSLAGGEAQRIRLANQIGSKLTGILYILDEPSIGLHIKDQKHLIEAIKRMRDLGNTVIVVEHDKQTIMTADWIIDVGPKAGKDGGRVIFSGTPKELLKANTLTGEYLSGRKKVEIKNPKSKIQNLKFLTIRGAKEHNLKNITVKLPVGKFICLTGVSGSGKSSLMNDILAKALLKKFYHAKDEPGSYKAITGIENFTKVVLVDQSAIGRTPRSNPATYTGIFSHIRDIFTQTKQAEMRGYSAGRFSFNVRGGRCEECEGQGVKKIEMYFLPDVYIQCPECEGQRFNNETLEIEHKGKNISEILEMTAKEALGFFKGVSGLEEKIKTLNEVGLGYVKLGQPAPSLSGGEAQRVKLATELSRKSTGKSIYILDEPTTGLHFEDIKNLISVLRDLTEKGNTVVTIEHNLDFIKSADWIIDLGPEGGDKGGRIVAEGTPKEIVKIKTSYTGQYLKNN